ncbi:MAG: DUF6326 family protein [Bacteroidota bacterium]
MHKIPVRTLVSTLWICTLFTTIVRDLHEFPTEGYVEEMMTLKLSDEVMLFYGFIVEIPISMIFLTLVLPIVANRWANSVAVLLTLLGIYSTLPAGDLDDAFFAIINTIYLVVVLIAVWKPTTLNRIAVSQ